MPAELSRSPWAPGGWLAQGTAAPALVRAQRLGHVDGGHEATATPCPADGLRRATGTPRPSSTKAADAAATGRRPSPLAGRHHSPTAKHSGPRCPHCRS